MTDLNELSEQLLLAVKMQEPTDLLLDQLASTPYVSLDSLVADDQKLAFWINIYNAFYQLKASENPDLGKRIFCN